MRAPPAACCAARSGGGGRVAPRATGAAAAAFGSHGLCPPFTFQPGRTTLPPCPRPALQMYYRGKMFGFVHLYSGQEAVSSGVIRLLRPDDKVCSTYRDHVHALSKGVPAREVRRRAAQRSAA